jgi:transposase
MPKAWVEQHLVKVLRPGDLVVMDNLSSHKGPRIIAAIEVARATVRYLPPYSPDLNPIELAECRKLPPALRIPL